jgi:uncharacterized protein YjbJ (UPF0337 family)
MEPEMSSTTDKIKGSANKATGKIKQGAGEAIDDDKLKAKGKVQEVKGELQKGVGKAKDTAKEAANKVARKADEKL